jgi:hypothetical protein
MYAVVPTEAALASDCERISKFLYLPLFSFKVLYIRQQLHFLLFTLTNSSPFFFVSHVHYEFHMLYFQTFPPALSFSSFKIFCESSFKYY